MILSFISETRVVIYMKQIQNVYQMRLEICCCNMYRYLQKTNGDPEIEGQMLLENSACILISRHK